MFYKYRHLPNVANTTFSDFYLILTCGKEHHVRYHARTMFFLYWEMILLFSLLIWLHCFVHPDYDFFYCFTQLLNYVCLLVRSTKMHLSFLEVKSVQNAIALAYVVLLPMSTDKLYWRSLIIERYESMTYGDKPYKSPNCSTYNHNTILLSANLLPAKDMLNHFNIELRIVEWPRFPLDIKPQSWFFSVTLSIRYIFYSGCPRHNMAEILLMLVLNANQSNNEDI